MSALAWAGVISISLAAVFACLGRPARKHVQRHVDDALNGYVDREVERALSGPWERQVAEAMLADEPTPIFEGLCFERWEAER